MRIGPPEPAGDGWQQLGERWAKRRRIVQLGSDFTVGDATSAGAAAWQRLFQRHGFDSPMYAQHVERGAGEPVEPVDRYRPTAGDVILFHYTLWSDVAEQVTALAREGLPIGLVYHNVTPPEHFRVFDPGRARATRLGRSQLGALAPATRLAIAVSEYNRQELAAAGFAEIAVVPLLVDLRPFELARTRPPNRAPTILVVGRVVPSKRIEEAIAVFAYYQQIEPDARLVVVGSAAGSDVYVAALRRLVSALGVADGVAFTGRVSQPILVEQYRAADVLLMLSAHEGFGVPLLEAMTADVPIVARAAAAIPETAGPAALLIDQPRYDVIAELINLVRTDLTVRSALIRAGRERVAAFSPPVVAAQLADCLGPLLELG